MVDFRIIILTRGLKYVCVTAEPVTCVMEMYCWGSNWRKNGIDIAQDRDGAIMGDVTGVINGAGRERA